VSAEKLRIVIFRCAAPYHISGVIVVSTKIARLLPLKQEYLTSMFEIKEI